jgi:hypothetical protein
MTLRLNFSFTQILNNLSKEMKNAAVCRSRLATIFSDYVGCQTTFF